VAKPGQVVSLIREFALFTNLAHQRLLSCRKCIKFVRTALIGNRMYHWPISIPPQR
jgi:hypothetical protein